MREKYHKIFALEENKEKSIDELFDKVPAICYGSLLDDVLNASAAATESSSRALDGLGELYELLVRDEIESMPRRVAHEKSVSTDEQRTMQSSVYDRIGSFLVDEFSNTSSDDDDDALFYLFGYEAPVERNKEGNLFKRHILTYWKSYADTLSHLLERVRRTRRTL